MNTKELALALLRADSEETVVSLLDDAGYWDNPSAWRLYGDMPGNWSTIGNQQAKPEAALVEKIVNSIDSRLMSLCRSAGIDPEGAGAPSSVADAVKQFIGEEFNRRDEANKITLAATGTAKRPSLTIVDAGEGIAPESFGSTILSLSSSNKHKVKFVQGKFNMGGSGVLRHCGERKLQLILSRCNPELMDESDDSANPWGVTVVRRNKPSGKSGKSIHSEFEYLAPHDGQVPTFESETLPLFPEGRLPYERETTWGTAIKLFEYKLQRSSNILRQGELMNRLELLMPEIPLPVRLHECRSSYKGKAWSFDTNLEGLVYRLTSGKGDALEQQPHGGDLVVEGQRFKVSIYVFKKGKAKNYTSNDGVVFSINGQSHGSLPKSFFGRKSVGLGRIGNDVLVLIDCTDIDILSRENLFHSSRDRLTQEPIRKAVEKELEAFLRSDTELRELQNKRKDEDISDKLSDQKPLNSLIQNIVKSSPALSALFTTGNRISLPKAKENRNGSGSGGGSGGSGPKEGDLEYNGKPHPTYFRFKKAPDSDAYSRPAELGRKVRVDFETDVENSYFIRKEYPGSHHMEILEGVEESLAYSLNLRNGVASVSLTLPDDVEVGQVITVGFSVEDSTFTAPLVNVLKLTVVPKAKAGKPRPPKPKDSFGGGSAVGLATPNVVEVDRESWEEHGFDKLSGCHVIDDGEEGESDYTFYLNVDNAYLHEEMKHSAEPQMVHAQFKYGMILTGLAVLQSGSHEDSSEGGEEDASEVEAPVQMVRRVTRAMGPFLLPMISGLGNMESSEASELGEIGDDE